MISNQRGSTAQDAPGYGVTWGGVPFYARRAMTVAAATLVVAGLAGPTAASAATTTVGLVGRPGVGHRPRAPTVPVTRPSARSSAFGGTVGRQLDIIGGFTADGAVRPARRAPRRAGRRSRSPRTPGSLCRAPTSSRRRPRPARSTRSPTRSPAPRRCGTRATPARASTSPSSTRASSRSTGFTTPGKVVYGPDLTLEDSTARRRTSTPTATARTWPASSPAATPPRPTGQRERRRLRRHGSGLPDRQHQGR